MNFHQYYPVDIVNGPGTRCTLFVSGCVHECPGCYNKSTWRVNSGQPFTKAMEDQIINDLNDTRIKRQGISLSGGDPLHPQNVPDILKLVQRIRAECPGKDIWVWTGYKLDELNAAQMQVVDLINVLVDGKFVQDLKDPSLIWRGRSRQFFYCPAIFISGNSTEPHCILLRVSISLPTVTILRHISFKLPAMVISLTGY